MNSEERKLLRQVLVVSEIETNSLAKELCTLIKPGMSVGLIGNLGAGKTTFTRHFVAHLGGNEQVSSPTFVLQQEYLIDDKLSVEHWDLYRINVLPEDLIANTPSDVIRIIEWPDKIPEIYQNLDFLIRISSSDYECGSRTFEIWK